MSKRLDNLPSAETARGADGGGRGPQGGISRGLEGIEVDTTAVSCVDGDAGTLRYRGYAIEELATLPFAAVAHLVAVGTLPDPATQQRFATQLHACGEPDAAERRLIEDAAARVHPMCLLQALLALAGPAASATAEQADLTLCARVPMWVAYIVRQRSHADWPAYPASIDLHARVLTILQGGVAPAPAAVQALDVTQILQLEHGFNAGTFAARVVLSTRAPFANAAAAALGALYGPLHGGADEAALLAAAACGSAANAAEFVAAKLAGGERVMGMGHREYRTADPRALLIKPVAVQRAAGNPALSDTLATLEAIEAEFGRHMRARGKSLHANVDFYKGVVYLSLGIPADAFTAMFAAARMFGYAAHAAEQRADNRLIRPAARYVGPAPRALARG